MSKKHYVRIAKLIAAEYASGGSIAVLARQLAEYFADNDPAFDHARFLKGVWAARLMILKDGLAALAGAASCRGSNGVCAVVDAA